jgi:hypothetical protein
MMEILTCDQLSDEWFSARIGSIGGSGIASVVAKGQGKMRKNLLYRLAGEILSGEKYQGYTNADMDRGIEQEQAARDMYAFEMGKKCPHIELVGIVKKTEHKHYSPDALLDNDGVLEIKCTIPSVHIETIVKDEIPPEYRKQCQWGLFICECDFVDFVSYSPLIIDKPILIIRRGRDEKLIKELDEGAYTFVLELKALVERIKGS